MNTHELFRIIQAAQQNVARGLWRQSFVWDEKARLMPDRAVAQMLRHEGVDVLHEAQRMYEEAEKMVIPMFSEN